MAGHPKYYIPVFDVPTIWGIGVADFDSILVVMSFRCEHCGARNTEVRSTGTIKVHAGASDLHRADLGRQIVRSEAYTVEIPDIELELPPVHGQLTIDIGGGGSYEDSAY